MDQRLLNDIRSRLAEEHGRRFRGVVLFGSEARGEAAPHSDIDVLVLLQGPVRLWQDLSASVHALYPLTLSLGRTISPKPVDEAEYERVLFPLYPHAKREGIRL